MRSLAASLLLACTLFGSATLAYAQQDQQRLLEARRLLMQAGSLVSGIPESQRASAAANISGQLVRTGDLTDALTLVQSLKGTDDRDLATGSMSWEVAKTRNLSMALALIETMASDREKANEYAQLAALMVTKGDPMSGLKLARLIKDPLEHVNTLVRIASLLGAVNHTSEAAGVLTEALKSADEMVRQDPAQAAVLAQIANAQADLGDPSSALQTLTRLSVIAHERTSSGANGALLETLGSSEANIGDLTDAQRTLEDIGPSGNTAAVLSAISEEQAKRGLVDAALETAARIREPGFRSGALREIAIIWGTHGAMANALDAVSRIPAQGTRLETLATLGLEQAEQNEPTAESTIESAWESARQAPPDAAANALEAVAVARSVTGDYAGAEEIIQGIKPESRVWPLWNLTSMLAEAGRTDEALTLAENQNSAHAKAYALLGTAQGILDRVEKHEKSRSGDH